jgi:hypothetical protein
MKLVYKWTGWALIVQFATSPAQQAARSKELLSPASITVFAY